MYTYTVTITHRPLGVRFGHMTNNKNQMVLSLRTVYPETHAFDLGMCAGDILTAINDESIDDLPPLKALELFRNQPLPFTASFASNEDSDSESCSDSEQAINAALCIKYINNSPTVIPYNNNTPSSQQINSILFSDINDCYLSDTPSKSHSDSYNSDTDASTSDVPSDCDSASEDSLSISIDSIKRSSSLIPMKAANFTCQFSPRPMHKLAVSKVSKPTKIQLPLKQSVSDSISIGGCGFPEIALYNPIVSDLLSINENRLYEEYFENIDRDTKDLVNGFLWNISEYMPIDDIINVLTTKYLWNNSVLFDKRTEKLSDDAENMKVCMVSNNGFYYGIHKWTIKINKCDVYRQEIGVVSKCDNFEDIIIQKGGISNTYAFGARAVYGTELFTNDMYYGSYNDNSIRCEKDINAKIGWCAKDTVTVILNLKHGNIQFFLNGKKVRKTMSLQKGKMYYPIVSFSGNCQYELISFE